MVGNLVTEAIIY